MKLFLCFISIYYNFTHFCCNFGFPKFTHICRQFCFWKVPFPDNKYFSDPWCGVGIKLCNNFRNPLSFLHEPKGSLSGLRVKSSKFKVLEQTLFHMAFLKNKFFQPRCGNLRQTFQKNFLFTLFAKLNCLTKS